MGGMNNHPPLPEEAPNMAARSNLMENWNMPFPSRPTYPHVAIAKPETPTDASLAHIRFEVLQNGNIRASLVIENMWFTAFFRNQEDVNDAEGERVVGVEDVMFDVGNLLEYIGCGDEASVSEHDRDGQTGLRMRPDTAQRLLTNFNAQGGN